MGAPTCGGTHTPRILAIALSCAAWTASVVIAGFLTSGASRAPSPLSPINATAWAFGSGPIIAYPAWPPPQTARSIATQRALGCGGLGPPPRIDGEMIARRLLALATDRRARGDDPSIVVLGGGHSALGLGNIFSGLTAAAVLAEALGAACFVTLGNTYAKAITEHLHPNRLFAFPCTVVSLGEMTSLRQQTLVPVVRNTYWRVHGMWNTTGDGTRPSGGGAYMLDFGLKYRELVCLPRPDAAKLLAPPGMRPSEFWRRLRGKFEEWVHAAVTLPLEAHERSIDATAPPWSPGVGTLCGHLRLLHVESHRSFRRQGPPPLPSCDVRECGSVLSAMEQLHRARPFASYFVTSGADCSHCLPTRAPTLFANATRISSGHRSKHILSHVNFDDALGAIADMRALARCALVVVDDKSEGTFALSLAAAGRLTPCKDPLGELVERWQPGYGGLAPSIARTTVVGQLGNAFKTRTLCATDDPRAPVTPPPWPRRKAVEDALADAVRFDLSRPWDPVLLPPPDVKRRRRHERAAYVPDGCRGV